MFYLSWDKYETYKNCPQWYSWDGLNFSSSRVMPYKKKPPKKDTQYLTRGNAIQDLVGRWIDSSLWLDPRHDFLIKDFLREETAHAVNRNWVQSLSENASPEISALELVFDIQQKLERVFPLFLKHIISQFKDLRSITIKKEVDIDHPYGDSQLDEILNQPLHLTCRFDVLVVPKDGESVIYEGKSTRKPSLRTDEQLRWQAQSLIEDSKNRKTGIKPSNTHYYLFYETAEFRPVQIFDTEGHIAEEHFLWLNQRHQIIQNLVRGEFKATPNRLVCQICKHKYHCPDVYVAKKRPTLEPKPSSSGKVKRRML